ncbi:ribosomal-protein-alanine N-acetyltransferase [Bacillus pakistanensis]|uniref:Ribosomal-protein-alanine N-acetyltransferase n=1 Tax=Rossellomorea pakistanensis TaxID=992288 RepID=A0ABS2N6L8_9BACI|nr:GNAT family protein [Bacillus pakistanensis]MBM7583505.1 ribosomal-protein-alanine N-acetyltransferase [Bacillus pakistanensis]
MLTSDNIYLRPFAEADAEELIQFQLENRDFFEKFAMVRDENFYTLDFQKQSILDAQKSAEEDKDYKYGIFLNDNNHLIGIIDLFGVLRGSLQYCFIGYFLDKKYNGKGYTTEAVKLMVEYAFEKLHLHRIEAGVMPHNIGSIRVLEKAGFHKEGIAIKNVKINGKWKDHQVLAIINPND